MWAQVMVCLVLGGTASTLQCPDGHKCEGSSICCMPPGENGYSCCDQAQFTGASLRMLTPNSLNEIPGPGCADGSTCPMEYSCLRTPDASFACCPWNEGVSCADGLHCCPKGSHCSADGHFCFQSQVLTASATVGAVQCPDHESECPNESTCCVMKDGSWGCCPMPEASCCTDKIHCCPHATTCDLEHTRCLTASGEQQPLQRKFPAWKRALVMDPAALSEKITCSDDPSACPDTSTCCQLPAGQYGCCPLQNAVCCDDHLHCCPQGTTCDMEHSKCALTPYWLLPMTSLSVHLQTVNNVQCDALYQCPDGDTCCQQPSGTWECCPLEEAVCCSDGIHCCPKGYQCNLGEGTCVMDSKNIPWLAKTSSVAASPDMPSSRLATLERSLKCDDQTSCSDEETCCQLAPGLWGCCPYAQAVCCDDRVHCCPGSYKCDLEHGICTRNTHLSPWTLVAPVLATLVRDVKCSDEASCPDGTTCCLLAPGQWGCCPYPQAVCCSDHVHCCPSGYQCAPEKGSCIKSGDSVPWLEKTPAISNRVSLNAGDVKCDDRTACPDRTTCCRRTTGDWGCCPIPEAVCCTDHIHCCPSGFTCDVAHGTCTSSTHLCPWISMASTLETLERDVRCDDQTTCLDGQTCCRLASGQWGCCPYAQAVCCSDHVHCCPSGYQCAPEKGSCMKSGDSVPWLEKTPAIPNRVSLTVGDVKCDDRTACPDRTTCCRRTTGDWGCCPTPEAVCCTDHIHCCPSGFTCDVAHGTCTSSTQLSPWISMAPILATLERDVRCDDQTTCLDGQTCCRLASGQWGCCPYAQAVCCSDHVHCCPSGYQCAPEKGSCMKSGDSVPWLEKTPAISNRVSLIAGHVKCDEKTACPDGYTCCRRTTGEWGCCAIPEAVCCADHAHCCPSGFTCDVAHGTCIMSTQLSPWISMAPILATLERDVRCDDQTSCPDGQTCCRLASGQWGCCPFAQAVCCTDRIHCCPRGYTCNQGSCEKSQHSLPWASKRPANALQSYAIHCNDTASCEEGQTCCKSVLGDWACCQLPNAICCDDHQHCCPSGYTCNTAAQTCEKRRQPPPSLIASVSSVPLLSSRTATLSRDVQCDLKHYCHDHQTCCQTQTGGWACCPFDKGTCCSDKRHCCPSGFRCSRSGLDCSKNGPLRWDTQPSFLHSTEARPLL